MSKLHFQYDNSYSNSEQVQTDTIGFTDELINLLLAKSESITDTNCILTYYDKCHTIQYKYKSTKQINEQIYEFRKFCQKHIDSKLYNNQTIKSEKPNNQTPADANIIIDYLFTNERISKPYYTYYLNDLVNTYQQDIRPKFTQINTVTKCLVFISDPKQNITYRKILVQGNNADYAFGLIGNANSNHIGNILWTLRDYDKLDKSKHDLMLKNQTIKSYIDSFYTVPEPIQVIKDNVSILRWQYDSQKQYIQVSHDNGTNNPSFTEQLRKKLMDKFDKKNTSGVLTYYDRCHTMQYGYDKQDKIPEMTQKFKNIVNEKINPKLFNEQCIESEVTNVNSDISIEYDFTDQNTKETKIYSGTSSVGSTNYQSQIANKFKIDQKPVTCNVTIRKNKIMYRKLLYLVSSKNDHKSIHLGVQTEKHIGNILWTLTDFDKTDKPIDKYIKYIDPNNNTFDTGPMNCILQCDYGTNRLTVFSQQIGYTSKLQDLLIKKLTEAKVTNTEFTLTYYDKCHTIQWYQNGSQTITQYLPTFKDYCSKYIDKYLYTNQILKYSGNPIVTQTGTNIIWSFSNQPNQNQVTQSIEPVKSLFSSIGKTTLCNVIFVSSITSMVYWKLLVQGNNTLVETNKSIENILYTLSSDFEQTNGKYYDPNKTINSHELNLFVNYKSQLQVYPYPPMLSDELLSYDLISKFKLYMNQRYGYNIDFFDKNNMITYSDRCNTIQVSNHNNLLIHINKNLYTEQLIKSLVNSGKSSISLNYQNTKKEYQMSLLKNTSYQTDLTKSLKTSTNVDIMIQKNNLIYKKRIYQESPINPEAGNIYYPYPANVLNSLLDFDYLPSNAKPDLVLQYVDTQYYINSVQKYGIYKDPLSIIQLQWQSTISAYDDKSTGFTYDLEKSIISQAQSSEYQQQRKRVSFDKLVYYDRCHSIQYQNMDMSISAEQIISDFKRFVQQYINPELYSEYLIISKINNMIQHNPIKIYYIFDNDKSEAVIKEYKSQTQTLGNTTYVSDIKNQYLKNNQVVSSNVVVTIGNVAYRKVIVQGNNGQVTMLDVLNSLIGFDSRPKPIKTIETSIQEYIETLLNEGVNTPLKTILELRQNNNISKVYRSENYQLGFTDSLMTEFISKTKDLKISEYDKLVYYDRCHTIQYTYHNSSQNQTMEQIIQQFKKFCLTQFDSDIYYVQTIYSEIQNSNSNSNICINYIFDDNPENNQNYEYKSSNLKNTSYQSDIRNKFVINNKIISCNVLITKGNISYRKKLTQGNNKLAHQYIGNKEYDWLSNILNSLLDFDSIKLTDYHYVLHNQSISEYCDTIMQFGFNQIKINAINRFTNDYTLLNISRVINSQTTIQEYVDNSHILVTNNPMQYIQEELYQYQTINSSVDIYQAQLKTDTLGTDTDYLTKTQIGQLSQIMRIYNPKKQSIPKIDTLRNEHINPKSHPSYDIYFKLHIYYLSTLGQRFTNTTNTMGINNLLPFFYRYYDISRSVVYYGNSSNPENDKTQFEDAIVDIPEYPLIETTNRNDQIIMYQEINSENWTDVKYTDIQHQILIQHINAIPDNSRLIKIQYDQNKQLTKTIFRNTDMKPQISTGELIQQFIKYSKYRNHKFEKESDQNEPEEKESYTKLIWIIIIVIIVLFVLVWLYKSNENSGSAGQQQIHRAQ